MPPPRLFLFYLFSSFFLLQTCLLSHFRKCEIGVYILYLLLLSLNAIEVLTGLFHRGQYRVLIVLYYTGLIEEIQFIVDSGLPFLCSGIDDDSSSLMQQKLERQVRSPTAVTNDHTLFDQVLLLFLVVPLSPFLMHLLFCCYKTSDVIYS